MTKWISASLVMRINDVRVFSTRANTPWNSWGGVLPSFPNPDPISDQKFCHFHACVQTWHLKSTIPFQTGNSSQNSTVHVYMEEIMSSFRLQRQQNDILKSFLNSNFTLSFLFI